MPNTLQVGMLDSIAIPSYAMLSHASCLLFESLFTFSLLMEYFYPRGVRRVRPPWMAMAVICDM